ncbi:MAG: hypothetical protein HUJ30_03465 [Gammaproteobacteria bacterium]|nr:hypothetical protein [Gammaproteobacteria bacterium]
MATVGKQTGPKTEKGKAASARNLEGHPTPEEAQRTRFNAMKGRGFNKTLHYYPARPGQFPMCATCEYLNDGCEDLPACVKNTQVFMRFNMAFESGDPSLLTDLFANSQAAMYTIFQNMLMRIIQDGETLEAPKMYYDTDGKCHVFEYTDEDGQRRIVNEKSAHPLLKHVLDFIQKNDMSLGNLDMTPKVQNEQATMKGFLNNEQEKREELESFNQKMLQGQQALAKLIQGEDVIELPSEQVEVVQDG